MPRWSWKPRLYYGLFGGAAIVVSSVVTYKEIRHLGSSPWITHPMFHLEHTKPKFEESMQYLRKIKRDYVLRFPHLHSTSHDPHVLLTLATASDPETSWLGIRALAARHPWTDAEYREVAAMIDQQTLVSLARIPHSDHRLFLPQPILPRQEVPIEEELRNLLEKLPKEDIDMCTLYFTALALEARKHNEKDDKLHMWTFDGNDVLMDREVNPEQRTLRVHLLALQVLLGYSKVAAYCSDIVSLGGLACLQHLMTIRAQHKLIQLRVARILANLTTQPHVHANIIQSGWVSVLHMWLNSGDLALSSLASKALANLDRTDDMLGGDIQYVDGVHLYYPQYRQCEPVAADIVFVHGLLGGPFRTWRQQDPPKKPKLKPDPVNKPKQKLDPVNKPKLKPDPVNKPKQKLDPPKTNRSRFYAHDDEDKDEKVHKIEPDTTNSVDMNGNKKDMNGNKKDMNGNKKDMNGNKKDMNGNKKDRNGNKKDMNNNKNQTQSKDKQSMDLVGSSDADPDSEPDEGEGEEDETVTISSLTESEEEVSTEPKAAEPYTFCWPKDWLAEEIPRARILTVEYETQLSEWAPTCPYDSDKRSQKARAMEMLDKLRTAGVGDRPIIWVGHSMGGLLIKQMLCLAERDPRDQHIIEQSHGLVFYSVPHRGSPLTAYWTPFFPSVEVKELKQDGPGLLDLNRDFEDLMNRRSIPLLSFSEGQKTNLPLNVKLLMVPSESSDLGFGTHYLMEDRSHLNICKPANRSSTVYRLTKQFISECIAASIAADTDDNPANIRLFLPRHFVFSEFTDL